MTTSTAVPDDDSGFNDAVLAAEKILLSEAEAMNLESVFTLAIRVGVWLKKWRELMTDNGYSDEWVEHAAMTLFQKFFTPFYPPFPHDHDEDDDNV